MAQQTFCTVDDVLAFLPSLKLEADNFTPEMIQFLIDAQASKIINSLIYRGFKVPAPVITPITNADYILFLLNVEQPVIDLAYRKSGEFNPALSFLAKTQQNSVKENFQLFRIGRFDFAFQYTLPTTLLTTPTDVAGFLPGFIAETDPELPPNIDTLNIWINMESAAIYCYAKYLAYETDYMKLTDDQKSTYAKLVAYRVGSHLIRARAAIYNVALNPQVNFYLTEAQNYRKRFYNREFDHIFGIIY